MSSLSIHTNDIVGVKKYPANYTKDLLVILEALSFKESNNVFFALTKRFFWLKSSQVRSI